MIDQLDGLLTSWPGRLYDGLAGANNHLTEHTRFNNLGYWRDGPTTLDAACRAMADLVGETAGLGPTSSVLDCGFGYGDQDIYWANRFGIARLVGLNVSQDEVRAGRRAVQAAGLDDRVDLRAGSATAIPLADASVDRVVSVEAAMHFRTRDRFLREAYRVLVPGGRLVVTDVIPLPGRRRHILDDLSDLQVRLFWQIPLANMYDRTLYARKLARLGFLEPRVESIRDDVIEPSSLFIVRRLRDPEVQRRMHPAYFAYWSIYSFFWQVLPRDSPVINRWDYVLASAVKPP